MDRKSRSSLEDPGGAASALRRLTQTPRLSLRRPGTTLSSASSISSASSTSHDHDDHSCVHRDAPADDCALNRFLVWVAIKRNACPKMIDEDRRQCPLLRCRKRFPNHELMLRHLYSCEQLAAGEYWCYDCEREERFTDARTCKRCLGHPSKRKKIVGMAKNFFRELGHKSRAGSLPDLDLESSVSSEDTPPSADDFGEDEMGAWDEVPTPQRPELQGSENQIHEIDSMEVPLSTIWEEDYKGELSLVAGSGQGVDISQVPRRKPLPIPRTVTPAELETVVWNGRPEQMPAIAPQAYWGEQETGYKPTLQVQTSNLFRYYGSETKRRSKMLAPSSSVRSNASTDSTNSTVSTNSYAVSVMSNGSNYPAYDSGLTTPADDFAPPNPFKPSSPHAEDFANQTTYPNANLFLNQDLPGNNTVDPSVLTTEILELPADVSMVDVTPPTEPDQVPRNVDVFQQSFDLVPQPHPTLPYVSNLSPDHPLPQLLSTVAEPQLPRPSGKATTLVKTAWEALQLHILESMKKLRRFKDNDLAKQLQAMSPKDVASTGLQTLLQVLDRSVVTSPVQLLCFIHLAYSFSVVVHEQDAPSRGPNLFKQAISYASWLTRADRHAYLPIVDILWKPGAMSRDEVQGLMRKSSSAAASRVKGKMPAASAPEESYDTLALVAQFFLDELEHAALQETEQGTVQASELCVQHLKDPSFGSALEPQVDAAIHFMQQFLVGEYGGIPRFTSKLQELKNKASPSRALTARRLELELMHIGKTCLPSDTFFDHYISNVRTQIDYLYSISFSFTNTRPAYHRLGVKLIELIVHGPCQSYNPVNEVSPLDDFTLDDLLGPMEPNLDNFDFSTFADVNTPFGGNDTTPADFPTDQSLSVTPQTNHDSGRITAGTSPPSHEPTPTGNVSNTNQTLNEAVSGAARIESNSCCEICGYRPEGDPRWFPGSMAKHKKLQHASTPPKIYACPFPGCKSQYTNRPDNLRQHQIKKNHFVEGQGAVEEDGSRPCKRKKMS